MSRLLRSQGIYRTSQPVVSQPATTFPGPRVTDTSIQDRRVRPDRRRTHSFLGPPTVLATAPVATTLTVVGLPTVSRGRLHPARTTHPKLAPPAVVTTAGFIAPPILVWSVTPNQKVVTERGNRRRTTWLVSQVAYETSLSIFGGPEVTLARTRPRPTHPRLPQIIVPTPAAQVFYGPSTYCVSPDRLAHRYRRWQPIPSLGPPVTLQTFFGPVVKLARIRPRPTLALVSQLTFQTAAVITGPDVTLTRIRPRPVRVRLPQVTVAAAQVFYGPSVNCVSPDRLGHRYHRQPPIPGLAPPTVLQTFATFGPRLVRTRPRKPFSFLNEPATLEPESIQDVERKLKTPLVRTRPRKTRSFLSPPTVLQTFAGPAVALTHIRPRPTRRFLNAPTAIRVPSVEQLEQTIRVALTRARPRPTTKAIFKPTTLQTFVTFGPVLARARPRRTHVIQIAPATLQPYAVTLAEDTVRVTLARIRPRPTSKFLVEPTTLQVFGGPLVALQRIRPRRTHAVLEAPTVVAAAAPIETTIAVTVARIRPRPRTALLSPPTVIFAASPVGEFIQVQARIRPRHTISKLYAPTVIGAVAPVFYGPAVVSVSPDRLPHRSRRQTPLLALPQALQVFQGPRTPFVRTRPRPRTAYLSPPAAVFAAAPVGEFINWQAKTRPRHIVSKLPLTIVPTVAQVFYGPQVTLAKRVRPRQARAQINPPPVVRIPSVEQREQTISVTLTRARPRPTHVRQIVPATLQPYAVTLAEDTIRTALVRSRPRPTRVRLAPPTALQIFSTFGPWLTHVRPRPTVALLAPPATLEPESVALLEREIRTALVRIRPRPTAKTLAEPTTLQVFSGPEVALAKIRPRPTRAVLAEPTVVRTPSVEQLEETIRTNLTRTRPRPFRAALFAPQALQVFAGPAVHLTRTRPRPTVTAINPPTVIRVPSIEQAEQTILVKLQRTRPRPTTKFLLPPRVIISNPPVVTEITTVFAVLHRRADNVRRSVEHFLRAPARVIPLPTQQMQTVLVWRDRIKPRPTTAFLRRPTVLQTFAGPTVALARIRPRPTVATLAPPATLEPESIQDIERRIRAPFVRTRPRPTTRTLGEPTVLQTFEGPSISLVRIRPRPITSFIREPQSLRTFAFGPTLLQRIRPVRTHLALRPPTRVAVFVAEPPSILVVRTRPRPTTAFLQPPATLQPYAVTLAEDTIRVALVRTRPRATHVHVTPPRVAPFLAAPIQTHLVRTRPRPTRHTLAAPTALQTFQTFGPVLVQIRPQKSHTRVTPPTLVEAPSIEQAERTIRVVLARTRPPFRHVSLPVVIGPTKPPVVTTIEVKLAAIYDRLRWHLYQHRLPIIIGPKRTTEPTGVTEGYDIAGTVADGDSISGTSTDGDDIAATSADGDDIPKHATGGYDIPATSTDGEDRPL